MALTVKIILHLLRNPENLPPTVIAFVKPITLLM